MVKITTILSVVLAVMSAVKPFISKGTVFRKVFDLVELLLNALNNPDVDDKDVALLCDDEIEILKSSPKINLV